MRISGWLPSTIHVPPSVKQDKLLILALFTCNCLIYSAWTELGQVLTKPWLLLVWLYGLISLVPLVWRDRWPLPVFATQWLFTVVAWPILPHYIPALGMPVALYAVSVHCGRKVSVLALLATLIPTGLNAAAEYKLDGVNSLVTNGLFFVAAAGWAWGLGRMTQAGRRHVEDLEHERESAREAEVLAAERRRIARELHDIVSHAVTVIVLQAAGAARVAETDFSQVTRSLAHIETAGKQAMAELRRLLGVLADSDPASDAAGVDGLKPQPGLADLTELLDSLRAAGMPVALQVAGLRRELDSSLDLTAYRIVQEGLVNVLKHAGKDSNPRLGLVWKPQSLLIQIENDTNFPTVHHAQPFSGGRGLVGLRERAHAAGGDLDAGPYQGGYRLTATIPFATPGVSSAARGSTQSRGEQGKVSV
ncbi:MAG TPA: histidine kinase [Pseudonocardiaceae bacterium]|jgi:signal transduction histidine kinase|nr:histidine kinase [Pseudonocardiaceae bacterium]